MATPSWEVTQSNLFLLHGMQERNSHRNYLPCYIWWKIYQMYPFPFRLCRTANKQQLQAKGIFRAQLSKLSEVVT